MGNFGYRFVLKLFSIYLVLLSHLSFADNFIDTNELPVGENRQNITKNDIKIIIPNAKEYGIRARIDESSIIWNRFNEILLIPRARLKIRVKKLPPASFISYKNRTINFQHSKKYSFAELNVSLYEKHPILIKGADIEYSAIKLKLKPDKKPRILIDYTCSRNNITVEGLKDEHFTIGC